jgi:DNA-directed RNA polymerase subunit M/transcription elongation factor TFIIS
LHPARPRETIPPHSTPSRLPTMSIKFSCPKCKTVYTVNELSAGKEFECKSCGARMRVPGESRPEPRANEPEPARVQTVTVEDRRVPPPAPVPERERESEHEHEHEPDREPERQSRRARVDRDGNDFQRWFRGLPVPAVVSIVVWAMTFVSVFVIGLVWFSMMRQAPTAIQEAGASAMAAALLIGVYVVARSVEKILASIQYSRKRA